MTYLIEICNDFGQNSMEYSGILNPKYTKKNIGFFIGVVFWIIKGKIIMWLSHLL